MDEEEFDSLMSGRPFRREDFLQAQTDAGRLTSLYSALFGRTPADLDRQLAASHPQIPPGCTIADLRRLQDYFQKLAVEAGRPQNAWLMRTSLSWLGTATGSQTSTGLDDRLEVLRRAIEYLEKF